MFPYFLVVGLMIVRNSKESTRCIVQNNRKAPKKKRKCGLQLRLPAFAHLKIAPLGMDLAGRQM